MTISGHMGVLGVGVGVGGGVEEQLSLLVLSVGLVVGNYYYLSI